MTSQPDPALTQTSLLRRIDILEQEVIELRGAAYYDELTGLGNRRLLETRSSARGGFFVLADLDGFKDAQDAHPQGHAFGDVVLREFSQFLLSICRTNRGRCEDRVAVRTGGDEFVVWCPTRHGARRIKGLVRAWSSQHGPVTASAGMGACMESADAAMYMDKRSPRPVVVRNDPEDTPRRVVSVRKTG